jgi:hypothetical protein
MGGAFSKAPKTKEESKSEKEQRIVTMSLGALKLSQA